MESAPLSVCIVDDDDAVRDSLCLLLEAHGLCVEAFSSPLAYLNRALDGRFDCLVLDLHMPEMTGLELTERLRAEHVTTPVIILTGRIDRALAPRMERACIAALLSKPVSEEELLAAIKRARALPCSGPGCK